MRTKATKMCWCVVMTLAIMLVHEAKAFAPSSLVSSPLRQSPLSIPSRYSRHNSSTRRFTLTIEKEEPQGVGAATFSLIKAIVGSGVLAMPAGLAVVTDAPKA